MTAADLPTTLESSACTTNVDGGPAAIGATGGTESEEEHDNEDINEKLREDAMLAATNPKPNPNTPPNQNVSFSTRSEVPLCVEIVS